MLVICGLLLAVGANYSPALLLSAASLGAAGGEIHAVPYLPGARHDMDIYLPAHLTARAGGQAGARSSDRPPVVVFFHGGGWRAGERAKYRFVGRSLAACGAIAILPEYRIWPAVRFPDFLRDGAAAVAAARAEAVSRGGDPNRLFLMGHSAGAYIAAMLDLDPTWLGEVGIDPKRELAGVIGLAGPYDFDPTIKEPNQQIFAPGGRHFLPIGFAVNAAAPMLLFAGGRDRVVDSTQTVRFTDSVLANGGTARMMIYPNIDHEQVLHALAWPLRFTAPVWKDTCRFLRHEGRHASFTP